LGGADNLNCPFSTNRLPYHLKSPKKGWQGSLSGSIGMCMIQTRAKKLDRDTWCPFDICGAWEHSPQKVGFLSIFESSTEPANPCKSYNALEMRSSEKQSRKLTKEVYAKFQEKRTAAAAKFAPPNCLSPSTFSPPAAKNCTGFDKKITEFKRAMGRKLTQCQVKQYAPPKYRRCIKRKESKEWKQPQGHKDAVDPVAVAKAIRDVYNKANRVTNTVYDVQVRKMRGNCHHWQGIYQITIEVKFSRSVVTDPKSEEPFEACNARDNLPSHLVGPFQTHARTRFCGICSPTVAYLKLTRSRKPTTNVPMVWSKLLADVGTESLCRGRDLRAKAWAKAWGKVSVIGSKMIGTKGRMKEMQIEKTKRVCDRLHPKEDGFIRDAISVYRFKLS